MRAAVTQVGYPWGALVEPLSVALHAVQQTPMERGDPVLVLGGGPVGQAVALWARHFGARDVVVSDPVEHRRSLALDVGATATIDPSVEEVAPAFERLTGQVPCVVLECVGVPGLIQHAFEVVASDGHVTVVGMCIQPDQIRPTTAMQKELSVRFVLFYRRQDFDLTITKLRRRDVDPEPLITDAVGLDLLPERFEALKRPTTECKVLIEP